MSRLPSDLSLRELSAEHAADCASVTAATDRTYLEWMREGWQPADEEAELAHYAEILAEPDRWGVGAYEQGGRMVGFTCLRAAGAEEGQPSRTTGHLGALFVHPDRWREGIAAALLELAEDEMRRRSYTSGRLRTPVGAPAIAFYRRYGWSENGEDHYVERYDLRTIGFSKRLDPGDA